jgi:hypothetical protein
MPHIGRISGRLANSLMVDEEPVTSGDKRTKTNRQFQSEKRTGPKSLSITSHFRQHSEQITSQATRQFESSLNINSKDAVCPSVKRTVLIPELVAKAKQ